MMKAAIFTFWGLQSSTRICRLGFPCGITKSNGFKKTWFTQTTPNKSGGYSTSPFWDNTVQTIFLAISLMTSPALLVFFSSQLLLQPLILMIFWVKLLSDFRWNPPDESWRILTTDKLQIVVASPTPAMENQWSGSHCKGIHTSMI